MPWQPPPDYPDRLLCNGRGPDQDFLPTEKLYFRIQPLQEDEEAVDFLEPGKIQSIPFSVNREKHSHPSDVLVLHSQDWGIGFFRVQDIPPYLESDTKIRFDFRVEHLPLEDESGNNYAHAEVKAFRNGIEISNKELGNHVKAAFRLLVSSRGKLFKKPSKPTEPPATH